MVASSGEAFEARAANIAPLLFIDSGGMMLTEDSYWFGIRSTITILTTNAHTAARRSAWRFSHSSRRMANPSAADWLAPGSVATEGEGNSISVTGSISWIAVFCLRLSTVGP